MKDSHTPQSPSLATVAGTWLFLCCLLLAICMLCAGCGTVKGLGQDLQHGSDVVREYMAQPSTAPSYPQRP